MVFFFLLAVWWFLRHIVRQHDCELAGKDAEIQRLIDERDREARRRRRRKSGKPSRRAERKADDDRGDK